MVRIFIFVDIHTKQENMQPSTQSIKIVLFVESGVHLAIPCCISRSSLMPSEPGCKKVCHSLHHFCPFCY